MRLYFVGGALLLAAFGLLQALMPSQPALLAMRAFEGLASGSFGPRALLAAFMFCRDGRLPMAAALAVFFLFVAGVIGFVMFGASESVLGSRGLFLVQFALGLLTALAGVRWLPRIKRMASRPPAYSVAPASIQHSIASSRPVAAGIGMRQPWLCARVRRSTSIVDARHPYPRMSSPARNSLSRNADRTALPAPHNKPHP